MNVNVALMPAKDCLVGAEIVYPLEGQQRMLWKIFEKSEDGIAARCDDRNNKDILIIPRLDAPVAVVTAKQQATYGFPGFHGATTTGTSNMGGWSFTHG